MGVNLRDLFPQHDVAPEWYHGKTVAVDGHNVAWRYLTSIRGRDGDVLRNRSGRGISHLIGMLGLVRQFRQAGAEPLVVWDGPIHPRKEATVAARRALREDAVRKAEEALTRGDQKEHHRLMRGTVWLTPEMIHDATRLLETLGVGVTTADHDGERFAAALCHGGHADAVATEDFDALVAGAPTVLRKAGSPNAWLHRLEDLQTHGLDQRQLRQVAIVCGTDWHPGIKGLGAKTAVKALKEHGDFRDVFNAVESGKTPTRLHRLIAESPMDLATFEDLDSFIARLPAAKPPRRARPSPEMAAATAKDLGISEERALACFC